MFFLRSTVATCLADSYKNHNAEALGGQGKRILLQRYGILIILDRARRRCPADKGDGLTFGALLAGICHRRMLLWAVQDASGAEKAAMKPKISARPSTASSHHTSSLCCARDTCASWS